MVMNLVFLCIDWKNKMFIKEGGCRQRVVQTRPVLPGGGKSRQGARNKIEKNPIHRSRWPDLLNLPPGPGKST